MGVGGLSPVCDLLHYTLHTLHYTTSYRGVKPPMRPLYTYNTELRMTENHSKNKECFSHVKHNTFNLSYVSLMRKTTPYVLLTRKLTLLPVIVFFFTYKSVEIFTKVIYTLLHVTFIHIITNH